MGILSNLKPQRVMHYFEALSRIPRESKHERAVSDYLKSVGESLGLETIQDGALNIMIKKPASPGKELAAPVILQGHMDMVCAKEKDKAFDFATEALTLKVEGDFITADGTTLGADNGIAVAMALALLEDRSAVHPRLEVLITTDEETGMSGALQVDGSLFEGKTLINIDSEEEGIFTVSCAGGLRVEFVQPMVWVPNPHGQAYDLEIYGLSGGHSGIEIHKGGANAIKLLGRALGELKGSVGVGHLEGGEKDNAIAKRAKASVTTDQNLEQTVRDLEARYREEYRVTDPDLRIALIPRGKPEKIASMESLEKLIDAMLLMPTGVQSMSSDIEGLVESSTNIGVLRVIEGNVVFNNAVRSSVPSLKDEVVNRFVALGRLTGADVRRSSDYPSWTYSPESPIRDLMMTVYEERFGKEAEIMAIHAGLETGVLAERIGELDMISIGPEMHDVHTPKERLSIGSTERTYAFLKEVLSRMD